MADGDRVINDEMFGRDRDVPTTEDCISRQEAINRIEAIEPTSTISDYQRGIAVGFALAKISIQEQRSVQQKTGHWVDMMVGDMPAQACDLCKTFFSMAHTGGGHHYCPNYCPNCGAKMIEPQKSEDKE